MQSPKRGEKPARPRRSDRRKKQADTAFKIIGNNNQEIVAYNKAMPLIPAFIVEIEAAIRRAPQMLRKFQREGSSPEIADYGRNLNSLEKYADAHFGTTPGWGISQCTQMATMASTYWTGLLFGQHGQSLAQSKKSYEDSVKSCKEMTKQGPPLPTVTIAIPAGGQLPEGKGENCLAIVSLSNESPSEDTFTCPAQDFQ